MRPIAELLDFLNQKMSMQAIYQPVVILHLLTRDGWATRSGLAQTLSGYDAAGTEGWDRILMDNPKRWLVGKHQILSYDKDNQTFQLNFDLSDAAGLEQAKTICERRILEWIQKRASSGELEEAEILRLYRVLELASRGDEYGQDGEIDLTIEEFGMQVAIEELARRYPGERMTQQPYDTMGYNLLVGTAAQPVAYVNVKMTPKPVPTFALSEGERNFSIQQRDRFVLVVVYAIDLHRSTYQIAVHLGAITASTVVLMPRQWQARLLH